MINERERNLSDLRGEFCEAVHQAGLGARGRVLVDQAFRGRLIEAPDEERKELAGLIALAFVEERDEPLLLGLQLGTDTLVAHGALAIFPELSNGCTFNRHKSPPIAGTVT